MLATPTFKALHKLETKIRAFNNNQYPRVWFKTHYLTNGSNVSIIVSTMAQVWPTNILEDKCKACYYP